MFVGSISKSSWRRGLSAAARRIRANCLFQMLLILVFWQLGEVIVHFAHLPIPGAIVGLFLMLGLLLCNRARPESFRTGAGWFLAQLLLFLMPTALALLDHPEFFGLLGLKIFSAILLGTLTVMLVTALVVDFAYRLLLKKQSDSHA